MSVTPPPSYPQLHPDLGQTDRKAGLALETTPQDLSTALDHVQAEAIGLPKKKIHQVEQPQMVNVFNYTGAVFGEDEEYDHAEFLVSIFCDCGAGSCAGDSVTMLIVPAGLGFPLFLALVPRDHLPSSRRTTVHRPSLLRPPSKDPTLQGSRVPGWKGPVHEPQHRCRILRRQLDATQR